MYSFNYHAASTVDEAAKLLGGADDGKFIAGGHTLIPAMKARLAAPSDLIDLSRIEEMKGIEIEGSRVTIRGGTTHGEIAAHEGIARVCPGLSYMAQNIGDPAVRYRGTIGGSVANNDPAADYPGALIAMDATVMTNRRELPASEFFTGLFETALEEDEIVTGVTFTAPEKTGYEKFRNPASRYALAGVFVARSPAGVRVAVVGAGDDGVFRVTALEEALSRSFDEAALQGITVSADDLMSDMHASAEYRANLIPVLAKRAVRRANG